MDYKKKISEYYAGEHKKSQQKIKYGIVCIIAIPLLFLILMFTMKSSKLVYLILWIAALFIISAYLISVEYRDYMMQKQLHELIGKNAAQPLIELPNIVELVQLEENSISKQKDKMAEENPILKQKDKMAEERPISKQKDKMAEENPILKQKDKKSGKKQKEEKIYTLQEEWLPETQQKEKNRTIDLEKEIQMLREIARLRTQLGMGDYSSLYKDDGDMNNQ